MRLSSIIWRLHSVREKKKQICETCLLHRKGNMLFVIKIYERLNVVHKLLVWVLEFFKWKWMQSKLHDANNQLMHCLPILSQGNLLCFHIPMKYELLLHCDLSTHSELNWSQISIKKSSKCLCGVPQESSSRKHHHSNLAFSAQNVNKQKGYYKAQTIAILQRVRRSNSPAEAYLATLEVSFHMLLCRVHFIMQYDAGMMSDTLKRVEPSYWVPGLSYTVHELYNFIDF